jgi:hypothetical protein
MKWGTLLVVLVYLLGFTASEDTLARGGRGKGGGHFHGGGHGRHSHGGHFHGGRHGRHSHGGHFRGRSSFGFFFGPSWGWPYYSFGPSILEVPVPVPVEPPVYIEQASPAVASQEPYYWYYCESSRAYYPYTRECPTGWLKVVPEPPRQEAGYWYRCENPQGYYPYIRECSTGWKKLVPEIPASR